MTLHKAKQALKGLTSDVLSLFEGVETARMALAIRMADAQDLFRQVPELGKFVEWALVLCPGESPTSLYRLANAGSVARVIGNVGNAKERALEPMYRVLQAATSDEERAAAEDAVRAIWAQACKGLRNGKAPTADKVTELVAAAGYEGTRGSVAAKKKSTKKGTAGKSAGKEETATVEIDRAAVDSARKEIERFIGKLVKQGADERVLFAGIAAGVKLSETYDVSTAFAAVKEYGKSTKSTS